MKGKRSLQTASPQVLPLLEDVWEFFARRSLKISASGLRRLVLKPIRLRGFRLRHLGTMCLHA